MEPMSIEMTPTVEPVAATPTAPQRRSLGATGWVVCVLTLGLVLVAVFAPLLAPYDPAALVGPPRQAPGGAFLFGTDQLGRDVLSRTLYGARQTLVIAVLSAVGAAVVGVPLGMLAGYVGRWGGTVIMRLMDVLLAFPGLLLALVVVTVRGPGMVTVILAVGISFTPVFARVIYGSTQRIRNQEYVSAARVVGCGPWRIMSRDVLPVVLTEVVVLLSSAIGWTTLLAATLNFLGFGVRPPTPEWGADLGAGSTYLSQAWWISVAPGLAITATILLANFLGDVMASLLEPSEATAGRSTKRAAQIPQITTNEE